MKSLLVSLLLFVFAQGAHAALINLNEWQSKKLYNILGSYGLRKAFPIEMQTREWAKPAVCQKLVNSGASYTCVVHDEFRNMNVVRHGGIAKKLYDFLATINTPVCEGPKCFARTNEIRCIHWWPNKDNPPLRRYLCSIDKWVPIPPSAN